MPLSPFRLVAALTLWAALALGPVIEHLVLWAAH